MSEYIIDMSNSRYQSQSGLLCADLSQLRDEIVRCRDCKRSEETPFKWFCHRFSMFDNAGFPVEPDGYCAWGERRENG